jgi:hypothetical protein
MTQCDVCARTPSAARYGRSFSRFALARLIALLGLFPLVFSAVSADDDMIQQEFGQASKHTQCFVQNWKAVPRTYGATVWLAHRVIVLQSWSSLCCSAAGRVPVTDMKVGFDGFSQSSGRSLPSDKATCTLRSTASTHT